MKDTTSEVLWHPLAEVEIMSGPAARVPTLWNRRLSLRYGQHTRERCFQIERAATVLRNLDSRQDAPVDFYSPSQLIVRLAYFS